LAENIMMDTTNKVATPMASRPRTVLNTGCKILLP